MSSLSKTFARASRRGKRLMEQYQPAGAYQEGEKRHREARESMKAAREGRAMNRRMIAKTAD